MTSQRLSPVVISALARHVCARPGYLAATKPNHGDSLRTQRAPRLAITNLSADILLEGSLGQSEKHELMAVVETARRLCMNRWVGADGLTEAARRQLMLRSNTVVMSRALRRQRKEGEVKEELKESESVRVKVRLSR